MSQHRGASLGAERLPNITKAAKQFATATGAFSCFNRAKKQLPNQVVWSLRQLAKRLVGRTVCMTDVTGAFV